MKRNLQAAAVVLLALAAGACGKKIGDECKDSVDCNSEDSSRSCDLSQPGGYCTVEGCDEASCPDEAVCVRFFPKMEFLSKVCDPAAPAACEAQDLCVPFTSPSTDPATAGTVTGRCAPRATESRRCMLGCGDDGDCRGGYSCQGTGGSSSSIALTGTAGATARFCAPRPR